MGLAIVGLGLGVSSNHCQVHMIMRGLVLRRVMRAVVWSVRGFMIRNRIHDQRRRHCCWPGLEQAEHERYDREQRCCARQSPLIGTGPGHASYLSASGGAVNVA